MVLLTRYHKKCKVAYLRIALIAIVLSALFIPCIEPVRNAGNTLFNLYINGKLMGKTYTEEAAELLMADARRKISEGKDDMVFIEADYEIVGEAANRGRADDKSDVLSNIIEEFNNSVHETMQHSYTVKIDEYMVNVTTQEQVCKLMEASIDRYDKDDRFSVVLSSDPLRELPVIVPSIVKNETEQEVAEHVNTTRDFFTNDGVYGAIDDIIDNIEVDKELSFSDYEYGITNMSFPNSVEIVEAYLPKNEVTTLAQAIDEVTKDKEKKTIYEVKSGDTLSGIADRNGITLDELISLNETLKDKGERSIIRVGDELTITVPKPELSVEREELVYYEGTYEADVIYVYNDSWYTTQEVTLQDPSSGYHKAVLRNTYLDNEVTSTETIKEEVIAEAIPKIVEKGTKIPPTYIKPISGGRLTSGYGGRTSLIAGMTSWHQGVDWGTPIGTSVVASCGGVVAQAGWVSGYGYAVYINHPDGRQTRYAHLSRVLCYKGQSVVQGEKIALSGNTGVSTGPHLHFEMRINGSTVNPLNYLY